jgi:organic hydroperoxide reductase OsmC/OhrA
MTTHEAQIRWQRGAGETFVDRHYSRAHSWHFDGGTSVAASSSPHAVPLPYSRADAVDPEEALVAAIASCHMLTFLYFAARAGYTVDEYTDAAIGELGKNADGRAALTHVTLRPAVVFSGPLAPDDKALDALHHRAHEDCVVASSVRATITVAGTHRHAGVVASRTVVEPARYWAGAGQ